MDAENHREIIDMASTAAEWIWMLCSILGLPWVEYFPSSYMLWVWVTCEKWTVMHLLYRFANRTVDERNIWVYDMLQCREAWDGRLELSKLLSQLPSVLYQALGKQFTVKCRQQCRWVAMSCVSERDIYLSQHIHVLLRLVELFFIWSVMCVVVLSILWQLIRCITVSGSYQWTYIIVQNTIHTDV